jgi:hypothetical protein
VLNVIQEPTFVTRPDGSFRLAVFPGPGVVYARSDTGGYLPALIAPEDRKKGLGEPNPFSGRPVMMGANAYQVIDPEEGSKPMKVTLEFVTGRSVPGTVVGPDGKPLPGARGTVLRGADRPLSGFGGQYPAVQIDKATGALTLSGLDPRLSHRVYFCDAARKLSALIEVKGDAKGPLTVKLEPWGSAKGRLLDAAGKPLAKAELRVFCRDGKGEAMRGFLPEPLGKSAVTDAEGRFALEGFLPGMTFDVHVLVPAEVGALPTRVVHRVKDLAWKPGEAKDLGEITTKAK